MTVCHYAVAASVGPREVQMRSLLTKRTTPILVIGALTIGITASAQTSDTVKKGHTPPPKTGAKLPPGKPPGPHRQPVDPNPGSGGDYGGDSAGGSGGGGYIGDPNSPGHRQY